MSWRAVSLIIALAACGPGGREPNMPDASVDAAVVVQPADSRQAQCYEQTTEVDVALTIQIQQSCAIWNSLAEHGGRSTVSRAATTLTIDFGNGVVFGGALSTGTVNLVYAHNHPYSDGCGWKATETLVGQLDPSTCNFTLSYDYVESVVTSD